MVTLCFWFNVKHHYLASLGRLITFQPVVNYFMTTVWYNCGKVRFTRSWHLSAELSLWHAGERKLFPETRFIAVIIALMGRYTGLLYAIASVLKTLRVHFCCKRTSSSE